MADEEKVGFGWLDVIPKKEPGTTSPQTKPGFEWLNAIPSKPVTEQEFAPPWKYKRESVMQEPAAGQELANIAWSPITGAGRALKDISQFGTNLAGKLTGTNPPEANMPEMLQGRPDIAGTAQEYLAPVGEAVGHLGTFLLGPAKFGKAISNPITKYAVSKLSQAVGPFAARIVGDVLGQSLTLGAASAISGPKIEETLDRFKSGAALGGIFGTMGWANIQKVSPFLNAMVRQVGTRVLGKLAGQYEPDAFGKTVAALVNGQPVDPNIAQDWFNEALFTYFSAHKTNPAAVFSDLARVKDELKKAEAPVVVQPQVEEAIAKSYEMPEEGVTYGPGGVVLGAPQTPAQRFIAEQDLAKARARATEKGQPTPIPETAEGGGELIGAEIPGWLKAIPLKPQPQVEEAPKAPETAPIQPAIAPQGTSRPETPPTPAPAMGEVPIVPKKAYKGTSRTTPTDSYLNEEINYGGEIKSRGAVIVQMQAEGRPQKLIDAYMMGAKSVDKGTLMPDEIIPNARQPLSITSMDMKMGLDEREALEADLKKVYAGASPEEFLKKLNQHFEKRYGTMTGQEKADAAMLKESAKAALPPRMPEENPPPAKQAQDVPEKSWKFGLRTVGNIKRMGQPGQKIASDIENYTRERFQNVQRELYVGSINASEILKNTPEVKSGTKMKARQKEDAIGNRLQGLVEGTDKPSTPEEANTLAVVQAQFKNIADEAERLGITIMGPFGERSWSPLKNKPFYPREWEPEGLKTLVEGKFLKDNEAFIIDKIARENAMTKVLYKDPATKQDALNMAKGVWESYRTDMKTGRYGHLEQERVLTDEFIEQLKSKWTAQRPDEEFPLKQVKSVGVYYRYLARANERLAFIRNFGTDVQTGKGGYAPKKLWENILNMENPDNRRWVERAFQNIINGDPDRKWKNISSLVRTFQLTKMTFSGIPNSLQWLTNNPMVVDTESMLKGIVDSLKFAGVMGKETKAEIQDFYYRTGSGRMKATIQDAMTKDPEKYADAADFLLRLYGFQGTEFYNRLHSAMTAPHYAIKMSEKLYKAGEEGIRTPFYRNELRKMGITDADMEKILKDGPLTKENLKQMADASYNLTKMAQFMTDAFFLPSSWSRTPGMKILTQFKNFAYNQSALIYNEPIKEAAKFIKSGVQYLAGKRPNIEGDLMKLVRASVVLPAAGALIYNVKKWLYPKLGITFYQDMMAGKSWPLKMATYVMNTGGLGIAFDAITSVGMGKTGLINLVGGPTVNDIFEFTDAIGKTWKELSTTIDHKNPEWMKHRSTTIASYWARFGARTSGTAKMIINQFFSEYKKIQDFTMWSALGREAYRQYKETYMLEDASTAEEFWQAFMETQGREYEEATGEKMKKPTSKEVKQWWKEQGKPPSERIPLPGTKSKSMGDWWY